MPGRDRTKGSEETDEDFDEFIFDWEAYCSDPESDMAESKFTYFLVDRPTEQQVSRFLRPFDEHDALLRRVMSFLTEISQSPAAVDDEVLITAARSHVVELQRQAALLGEREVAEAANAQKDYTVVEEIDHGQRADAIEQEVQSLISDTVIGNLDLDRPTAALLEALYNVTVNYFMTWYLAEPLIDLDLDMSPYYRLWSLGGDCLLTADTVLVERPLVK